MIAATGSDNGLQFWWQPIGSQGWNPEQVAGPGTTFGSPSVAQADDPWGDVPGLRFEDDYSGPVLPGGHPAA